MKTKNEVVKEVLLPEDLDINIIDVKYSKYDYTNKYDASEQCSNIAIKAIYKNEALRIVFYHGIGYKSCTVIDDVLVLREREFCSDGDYHAFNLLSPDVQLIEQPIAVTNEQEIVSELYAILYKHCFQEDTSLYSENPYFIEEAVDELEYVDFIIANIKIRKETISLKDIKEVEKLLNNVKSTYLEVEGKRLLKEMLSHEKCPQLFKEMAKTFKFSKVEFEKVVVSEDYMPDFGKYMVFEGILNEKKENFGFLFESSESFPELTDKLYGVEFKNEEDLSEFLLDFNHEGLFLNEKKEDSDSLFVSDVFDYIIKWSVMGYQKELFAYRDNFLCN